MATKKLGSLRLDDNVLTSSTTVIGEQLLSNGTQTVFVLAGPATSVTAVAVYVGGIRLVPVAGTPGHAGQVKVEPAVETESGNCRVTILSDAVPTSGDFILVDYEQA